MKNQLIISLAIAAFSLIACEDEEVPQRSFPIEHKPEMVIRSMYPSSGSPGTTVAIFGENFGPTIADHDVTFDSVYAEITYVGYGVINVKVPANLADGNYAINIRTSQQVATAPSLFTVTDSKY